LLKDSSIRRDARDAAEDGNVGKPTAGKPFAAIIFARICWLPVDTDPTSQFSAFRSFHDLLQQQQQNLAALVVMSSASLSLSSLFGFCHVGIKCLRLCERQRANLRRKSDS